MLLLVTPFVLARHRKRLERKVITHGTGKELLLQLYSSCLEYEVYFDFAQQGCGELLTPCADGPQRPELNV